MVKRCDHHLNGEFALVQIFRDSEGDEIHGSQEAWGFESQNLPAFGAEQISPCGPSGAER